MKKIIGLVIGFLLTLILAVAGWFVAEKIFESSQKSNRISLKPRQKIVAPVGAVIYEVKDNEVTIQGQFIDRVLIGKNVTITYRNKTDKHIIPGFNIRFYNGYGLMIASKKISGLNLEVDKMLEPGDVGSDVFPLEKYPIQEIFELSDIKVSEDLNKIKWIMISEIIPLESKVDNSEKSE